MSQTPEKCTCCGSPKLNEIPPWMGSGKQCNTCGTVVGKKHKFKDTKFGRDCEEDYY